MLYEVDVKRIKRNKEIYIDLCNDMDKRKIGIKYNIPETGVTYYSWLYKDHVINYNNNFIYKAIVDSDKITMSRKSATRLSHIIIKYFEDKESLMEAIKNKSIMNIPQIGALSYNRLKTIFEVEDQ